MLEHFCLSHSVSLYLPDKYVKKKNKPGRRLKKQENRLKVVPSSVIFTVAKIRTYQHLPFNRESYMLCRERLLVLSAAASWHQNHLPVYKAAWTRVRPWNQ